MLVKDHPYAETRPFPLSFFFSAIKETTVVDKHTVRFRMDDPYAPLLSNLAYPTGLIISPEAVKNTVRTWAGIQLELDPTNSENGKAISTSFWIRTVTTGMGKPD